MRTDTAITYRLPRSLLSDSDGHSDKDVGMWCPYPVVVINCYLQLLSIIINENNRLINAH